MPGSGDPVTHTCWVFVCGFCTVRVLAGGGLVLSLAGQEHPLKPVTGVREVMLAYRHRHCLFVFSMKIYFYPRNEKNYIQSEPSD